MIREIGAHILSGNVFEPRALDELLPNWKQEEVPPNQSFALSANFKFRPEYFCPSELQSPITVPVSSDKFWFLTKNHAFPLPCPFNNRGNYVIRYLLLLPWLFCILYHYDFVLLFFSLAASSQQQIHFGLFFPCNSLSHQLSPLK